MAKVVGNSMLDDVMAALDAVAQTDYGSMLDESRPAAASLHIPLAEIEPDPDQPRKFTDAEALQDLANSILQHGVIQPITVRRHGDKYQIVTGERRWQASKLALQSGEPCQRKGYDLTRIHAVIIEPETDTDRLEMQLVENLARADMSDEDTANALQTLSEKLGLSQEAIGKRIGRSKKWVANMLARTKPEAQEVADILGIPLTDIGNNELTRLISWHKDSEKTPLLQAVVTRLQSGDSFSRALLNEAEEQFTLESRLSVSGLPLDDLRGLDREVAKGNTALLEAVKAQATPDLQAARESLIAAKVAAQQTESAEAKQGEAEPAGGESDETGAEGQSAGMAAGFVEPEQPSPAVTPKRATADTEADDGYDNTVPDFDGAEVGAEEAVQPNPADYIAHDTGDEPDFDGAPAAVASTPAKPAMVALSIPQDLADRIASESGRDTPATAKAVLEALRELYD